MGRRGGGVGTACTVIESEHFPLTSTKNLADLHGTATGLWTARRPSLQLRGSCWGPRDRRWWTRSRRGRHPPTGLSSRPHEVAVSWQPYSSTLRPLPSLAFGAAIPTFTSSGPWTHPSPAPTRHPRHYRRRCVPTRPNNVRVRRVIVRPCTYATRRPRPRYRVGTLVR